jgi:Lanthionine synthetase C-like protein
MKRQFRVIGCVSIIIVLPLIGWGGLPEKRPHLEAALKAERWIAGTAVSTPGGLTWPADPQDPKSVNATLYAGSPGVILFYLELYAATGEKDYLKKAGAGADWLIGDLSQEKTMGLYEGAAGIGFALEETYKASGEEKYRRAFLQCLDLIRRSARPAGKGLEWDGTTDIISGSAGIGLFLLYAYSELADKSLLDVAAGAGDRLIELGKPANGGLKWAMDEQFPRLMPNFSHGTAGIAYFLATLYEGTKQKPYLDAALAGAKYLLSIAKTDGDACLIFHNEPDGKDLYYLGWCHGPVGTARLFYRLSKATGETSWMDWLKRSANGIMESGIPGKTTPGFWNNAGICCGLAGVGDFFLSLYETTRDKKHLDFCGRVTDKLLAAASADGSGLKWVQAEHRTRPELLVAQTGLMQGAAGIGLFLLHYDALERSRRIRIILPDTPFWWRVSLIPVTSTIIQPRRNSGGRALFLQDFPDRAPPPRHTHLVEKLEERNSILPAQARERLELGHRHLPLLPAPYPADDIIQPDRVDEKPFRPLDDFFSLR